MRSAPTGRVTAAGDTVTVWAMAGAAIAPINSKPSVNRLWPYVRTFVLPGRSADNPLAPLGASRVARLVSSLP